MEVKKVDKTKNGEEKTPSQLKIPSYMMNFPFSMSNAVPNNIFMKKDTKPFNKDRCFGQWMQLYNFMASQSLVYILPTTEEYQDLPWVANAGLYIPHTKDQTMVVANFTSPPRQGEEDVTIPFYKLLRYNVVQCPHKWEGEADLKWCGGKNWIGGIGMRSTSEAFNWFEKEFDMNIVQVKITREEQYHLDCSVFPLNSQKTLICANNYTSKEIKVLEKITEIIPVPPKVYDMDTTNCVLFYNMVLCNCAINEHKKGDEEYDKELCKIQFLEKVCADNALELVTFNLSEFHASGAALSCSVQNLNFQSYLIPHL